MAKPHERVFALVGALLFLASSVGVTFFVVWQIQQENQISRSENQATPNEQGSQNQLNQPEVNMLKGTKLQNFQTMANVDKLQFVDLVNGTGEEVKPGATVTAHYTGAYVVNGEIFESSKDSGSPATFPLDQVIAGWTQGVPGMKVGGTRRLIIPGGLAYGEAPAGYVPGSTDRPLGPLVFDIELTAVQNP